MAVNYYKYQAEQLVRNYLLPNPVLPYTSLLVGIILCKMAYDLTHVLSSYYFKCYPLSPRFSASNGITGTYPITDRVSGMSSAHAVYITSVSIYLVFFNNMFADQLEGPVTLRCSNFSTFTLGVSVGYFIVDLALIFWLYPSLGGKEFVVHHSLSLVAIAYTMLSGEGQLYTYMVLISEATTPEINLRWFLDTAGMKKSTAYLINGLLMFFAWLVARICLFIYLFYHMYLHYDQIEKMHIFGYILVFLVPIVLFCMNLVWFGKILKGIKKTLSKKK